MKRSKPTPFSACCEPLETRRLLSFTPTAESYPGGANPVIRDFDRDGRLDLAFVDSGVRVLRGDGDGLFRLPSLTSASGQVGPSPQSIAVGDFNGDAKLDLAAASYDEDGLDNDLRILLGNGDGTLSAAAPVAIAFGFSSNYVAAGHLDADGALDLVVVSDDVWGFGGQGVTVLRGRGDGTFAWSEGYGIHDSNPAGDGPINVWASQLADFNGDSATDVAVAVGTAADGGVVKVYLGNGNGTLQPARDIVVFPDAPYYASFSLIAGHFGGDARADLVAGGVALVSNGDGTFRNAGAVAAAVQDAADLNGDGRLDVVASSGGDLNLYLGRGDGTFAGPETTDTGAPYLNFAVLADVNNDGRPDAVVSNGETGNVSVLLNDGSPSPSPTITVSDATVTEGNTGSVNAVFTVALSRATNVDVTVRYDTANLTATAGSDYVARTGTLTIPAGKTSATFTVAVLGDRLAEPTETLAVQLSSPANATLGDAHGVGTILDNEPRIRIGSVSRSEGNNKTTSFSFTVSLTAAYDQAVTVQYATVNGSAAGGSDYQSKSGSITFAPGETIKTITIVVNGDKAKESNETFFADLYGAGNNAWIDQSRGVGTILNDDR